MSTGLWVRPGRPADGEVILGLWDRAIEWLVARGQLGQWGSESASSRPVCRSHVERWLAGDGIRIAELDGEPVGVCVLGERFAHVAAVERPETYVEFLVSSRDRAGMGIGGLLVRRAVEDARRAGSELLRVDCWAGAPSLVAWYERQGFVPSDTFELSDWRGQVFELEL